MTPDQYVEALSLKSDLKVENLIEIGYLQHAQSLLEAGIDPDEALEYLEGSLDLLEMVEEDTGIKLLDHGFRLFVYADDPCLSILRCSTVGELPAVRKYFPDIVLSDDSSVKIIFTGDVNLYSVEIDDKHCLDYQATHEKSGAKCLKKILGL